GRTHDVDRSGSEESGSGVSQSSSKQGALLWSHGRRAGSTTHYGQGDCLVHGPSTAQHKGVWAGRTGSTFTGLWTSGCTGRSQAGGAVFSTVCDQLVDFPTAWPRTLSHAGSVQNLCAGSAGASSNSLISLPCTHSRHIRPCKKSIIRFSAQK